MNEKKTAYCCHVGCENDAKYHIQGAGGFEDYTHMCSDHVEEYTTETDVVTKLEEEQH